MMTSRQKRAQQTRANLLEVGARLIEERGYESVSIKDIVEAAGVSVGTFYHYFDSKGVLYYAYIDQYFVSLREGLVNNMGRSPLENLGLYVDGLLETIETAGPEYVSHWLSHTADAEYHRQIGYEGDVSLIHASHIRDCIDAYVERGVLRPGVRSAVIAETVMTLFYGIDVRYCMSGGVLSLEAWGRNIKSFLYKNIVPFMAEPPAESPHDYDPDVYLDTGEDGPGVARP